MILILGLVLASASMLASQAVPPPVEEGDVGDLERLEPWLESALRSTEAFGNWPEGHWRVHLHDTDATFEQVTRAPSARYALWIGSSLHLRPWLKLQRRDLGALLRHELTHRRLSSNGYPRWKEEALCLWAEGHTALPDPWPPEPDPALQERLNLALNAGTTATQRWAYAWLSAWLDDRPLPAMPVRAGTPSEPWQVEDLIPERVAVIWSSERLPRTLQVNDRTLTWKRAARFRFEGPVRFGQGTPVSHLGGSVVLEAIPSGWRMTWHTASEEWIAAATEGELGADAPYEAKRALAAVLRVWLKGHPSGNHPDGTLCPLTHCAVVRGAATSAGRTAAIQAPECGIPADRAFFTGSKGGISWSPREVWGAGPVITGSAQLVPGDPWATWTRVLTAAQVQALKRAVRPGLRPGQRGLHLGPSGPYAVENLRIEAGRRFGWTTWPSNACEVDVWPDGRLQLRGHGWGHNVGLCLATAVFRARQGDKAEEILAEAFPLEGPAIEKVNLWSPPADAIVSKRLFPGAHHD